MHEQAATPLPVPPPQGGRERPSRGFVSSETAEQTFAANRAEGRVTLVVADVDGATRRRRVAEAGALRVRFPNAGPGELEALLVNTAGGMTGGDRFDIDVA